MDRRLGSGRLAKAADSSCAVLSERRDEVGLLSAACSKEAAMSFDVSAVIPTYNRANLIGDTVESVLRQSVPPAEIIVVDDGSTDDTAEVIARYGSAVRYHRMENFGPGAARNLGVSIARAPWIAFCD